MFVVSECVTCVVVAFTLSTFLFAFCVVLLAIEQQVETRKATSRVFQRVGMLFGARPAAVLARHKTFDR